MAGVKGTRLSQDLNSLSPAGACAWGRLLPCFKIQYRSYRSLRQRLSLSFTAMSNHAAPLSSVTALLLLVAPTPDFWNQFSIISYSAKYFKHIALGNWNIAR